MTDLHFPIYAAFVVAGLILIGYPVPAGIVAFGAAAGMLIDQWWRRGAA